MRIAVNRRLCRHDACQPLGIALPAALRPLGSTLAALFLACGFATIGSAQYTISTFAGGGPPNGSVATSIGLDRPYSVVAIDSAGDFYFSAHSENRIYKTDGAGHVSVFAGTGAPGFSGDGGLAINAQIWDPLGLALDSAGNLYIADHFNGVIRKVSGGIITTVAGGGTVCATATNSIGDGCPATSATLNFPRNMAVDSLGNLFISDTANQRIRKVSGGIITTVAGNGTMGYNGEGVATSSELNNPAGIALDAYGDLYIADYGNFRVRQVVLSSGTISTFAGGGTPCAGKTDAFGDGCPATQAAIGNLYGVAVDPLNNVYIADSGNQRIRMVSIGSGIITTVAGHGEAQFGGDGGPATSAYLWFPTDVSVDSAGNYYIADDLNNRIRKVTLDLKINTVAGNGFTGFSGDGGPATNAQFLTSFGVAADSFSNVYIGDTNNEAVRKVTGGNISTVAGDGIGGFMDGTATGATLAGPSGVAPDSQGNVYIADFYNNRVRKLVGSTISTIGGDGTTAVLNGPLAVAVDKSFNVYVADTGNNRVRKITGSGISTVAGTGTAGYLGDGGLAANAELNAPGGVAVDGAGNLYIADTNNNRIRKIIGTTITTVAGNGAAGYSGDGGLAVAAALNAPSGVALDSSGNLYISDTNNFLIRKVTNGIITTIAGKGSLKGPLGDGGPATNGTLAMPTGLSVDSAGNVYIMDSLSYRVRKLAPAATTIASLGPSSVSPGAPGFTLVVNGTNFVTGDVVLWNSSPLTTVYIGNTQLQAVVSSALVANGGMASVSVSVFGGGSSNTATFSINSVTVPVLHITKTHIGSFAVGQTGATFTATVTNVSPVATSGTVTVTETVPSFLTLSSMSGSGWTCLGGNTCSRGDVLAPGASYPPITITVNVGVACPAGVCPAQVTNQVTVSGGGSVQSGASDTVSIVPSATCTYSLANTVVSVQAPPSTGGVGLTANCGYSVPPGSMPNWIGITSGGTGSGSGSILYSIAANNGPARSASFTVVDSGGFTVSTFTINQASNSCDALTVPNDVVVFGLSGGNGTVAFNTSPCSWSATTASSWITLQSASGAGSGFTFTVAANNTGQFRSGTIIVNGTLTIGVLQNGMTCSYTISTPGQTSTSQGFAASGGSGSVSVTAPAGCGWAAASNVPFVTIPGTSSGVGSGTVSYNVASNAGSSALTGTIAIQGLNYLINEAAPSQSYSATVSAPAAPVVRADGMAELPGDLLITISGQTLSGGIAGDVVVTFNTTVTNHALSTDPSGQTTDALLLVNEPSAQNLTPGFNAFQGLIAGPNSIRFRSVPLAPTSSGSFSSYILRITNARVDASHLGASSQVTATVTIVAPAAFPVSNATQPVASVQADNSFTKGTTSAGPGSNQTLYPLTFTELTSNAYKMKLTAGQDPSVVGVVYNSESGYVNSAVLGTETGFATNATRLVARFASVPHNVAVYVPLSPSSGSSGTTAQLVSADQNGVGGFPVQVNAQGNAVFGNVVYAPVALDSTGAGTAAWEVTASKPAATETLTFNVLVSNPGSANLSGMQMTGALGPQASVSSPSLTAPVPRFVNGSAPAMVTLGLGVRPQGQSGAIGPAILRPTVTFRPNASGATPNTSGTLGGTLTVTQTLINSQMSGPPAPTVRIGTTLPPSSTITSCELDAGEVDAGASCTFAGNNGNITYPSVAPGQTTTLTLTADVYQWPPPVYEPWTFTVVSDSPNLGSPSTVTVNVPVYATPAPPTLLSPGNASTGVSPRPTLTWASNAIPGTTSYTVYLDTQNPPRVGTGVSVLDTRYTPPNQLNTNAIYYWSVTAINFAGTNNSGVSSFTTGSAAPATISSPTPGSQLPGTTATFTWTPIMGADYYWLDVGTSAGQGNICGLQVSGTSYTCSGIAPAKGSTTIYVQLWTHINGSWLTPIQYTYVAAPPLATITSPAPNSSLPGSTVTFTWGTVTGADYYWLDVGTAVGQGNICGLQVSGTSYTCSGIVPANGSSTIYVQLWTHINGSWQSPNRYTYGAPLAAITSPAPNSQLAGSTVTFTWTAVTGADYYWLDVGKAVGQGNICGVQVSGTSYTCSGIAPAAGSSTIYVQLWTHINGSWQSPNRYTYGAPLATITSPAPNSQLPGSTVTFTWTAVTGADYYWLDVGTAVGQGGICGLQVAGTSYTCSGIAPAAGSTTIYVQLWTHINGGWQPPNRYTYGAPGTSVATITSPAQGSQLDGTTVTFTWTAITGADYYWLDVGTGVGQGNICGLQVGGTSYTCSGIVPAGGSSAIYAQLWTHINGGWQSPNRYTYVAAPAIAAMTSPTPGSTLSGASVAFSWSTAAGAQAYWLDVGTAVGQGNIFGQNVGTALSKTVTGIPVNGQPIYVQLWTEINGTWYLSRYTYTAF